MRSGESLIVGCVQIDIPTSQSSQNIQMAVLGCHVHDALSPVVQGEVEVDIPALQQFQCVEVSSLRCTERGVVS